MSNNKLATHCIIAALTGASALAVLPQEALAQSVNRGITNRRVDPRRLTLERMMRPITLNVTDTRIEDIFSFVTDFTGASIDVQWINADQFDGLDPDQLITINVTGISSLALVERLLDRAQIDSFSGATWQLTPSGQLEVGPKSRLNRRAFVKLYDINDLVFSMASYTEAPQLDLNSVLNQGNGGGRGSIFRNEQEDDGERTTRDEEIQNIVDLVTTIIEPEQWVDNGGDAATIREFNGFLLVRAPDYMHRQIEGYPFWPNSFTPVPPRSASAKTVSKEAAPENTAKAAAQTPERKPANNDNK